MKCSTSVMLCVQLNGTTEKSLNLAEYVINASITYYKLSLFSTSVNEDNNVFKVE